jgi:ATP-dependent DNA helicase RecG
MWDEVSDWVDRNGSGQNANLCGKMDTLKVSQLLTAWWEQGLLVTLPDRAKRNMLYTKTTEPDEQLIYSLGLKIINLEINENHLNLTN